MSPPTRPGAIYGEEVEPYRARINPTLFQARRGREGLSEAAARVALLAAGGQEGRKE